MKENKESGRSIYTPPVYLFIGVVCGMFLMLIADARYSGSFFLNNVLSSSILIASICLAFDPWSASPSLFDRPGRSSW